MLNIHGHTIQIQRSGDGFTATASLKTAYGPATVTAQVPRGLVAAAAAGVSQAMVSGADFEAMGTGFDFGDIGKALGQAAKSKEFGQATGIIGAVAKNPMLQGLASAALGPEAGFALQGVSMAADAASTLAAHARKRDPKAVHAVKKLGDRARAGDPRAKRMAGLVAAAIELHSRAERDAAAAAPPPAPPASEAPAYPYAPLHIPYASAFQAVPVADGPYDQMAAGYANAQRSVPYTDLARQQDGSWAVASGGIAL